MVFPTIFRREIAWIHHAPCILNAAILLPIVPGLLRQTECAPIAVKGGIGDAPSLRVLVAPLGGGMLICLVLARPDRQRFGPVPAFQVIYKAMFPVLWRLPIRIGRREDAIPPDPTTVFLFIVLVWPFFIVAGLRSGQM